MAVHYLEIVSNDVDSQIALYERVHGLSFGPPQPDLGQARVATRTDGTLVGIRRPLAAHEQPIRPAAGPGRERAERHAAHHGQADRHEADRERDARAPDRARQHVTPQAVGAERMPPRRALEIGSLTTAVAISAPEPSL